MDIVLEVFDTYIADYCYAKALPTSGPSIYPQAIKHVASSTFSSLREGATPGPIYSYQPSTSFFSLEPTQYAYQSAWPRDSLYRQTLSLYFIAWCAGPPKTCHKNEEKKCADHPTGSSVWSSTLSAPPPLTTSSSTTQPLPTPNTSRTKSASRSDRPCAPCPACAC